MTTNYAGVDAFYPDLDLITDADAPRAQPVRVPSERLLDNTVHLRARTVALETRAALLVLKQAATLRPCAFTTAGSGALAVTALAAVENMPGPILVARGSESWLLFEDGSAAADASIPTITPACAASDPSGRVLVGGSTTPYCAIRNTSGVWSGGSNAVGGTIRDLIYSPVYGGFLAARTSSASVYRSVDGSVAWTSAATSLSTAVQRLAAIGAGSGSGIIVAMGNATPAPVFSRSTNNGSSFALTGTSVPFAAQADARGDIAACPLVTRNDLQDYVYHVASFDSGARLRIARTADGVQWVAGPTIEAPPGWRFGSGVTLAVCPTTGLMVITANATVRTGGADSVASSNFVYVSVDGFDRWVGPSPLSLSNIQVASGRVISYTSTTAVYASDGISGQVFLL